MAVKTGMGNGLSCCRVVKQETEKYLLRLKQRGHCKLSGMVETKSDCSGEKGR